MTKSLFRPHTDVPKTDYDAILTRLVFRQRTLQSYLHEDTFFGAIRQSINLCEAVELDITLMAGITQGSAVVMGLCSLQMGKFDPALEGSPSDCGMLSHDVLVLFGGDSHC